MSLQIETNCIRNSTGGTITGIVSLHLTSPLEIEHLAVTLSGKAQTDIDQSTTKTPGCIFRGQRVLFATRRILIKKPTTAAQGPAPGISNSASRIAALPGKSTHSGLSTDPTPIRNNSYGLLSHRPTRRLTAHMRPMRPSYTNSERLCKRRKLGCKL